VASDHCHNAISNHLQDAIKYNRSVSERYSELSKGKTVPLSLTLIAVEKTSKILVHNMENEAELYRKNGIELLCEELGDMKMVPVFQDSLLPALRPTVLFHYDYSKLSKNLKTLMNENKIDEAYELLSSDLEILENYPHQKCLTRHFLESMAKTLKLIPLHQEEASKLGLPDPLPIIKKFVTIQRRALFIMNQLDKEAFPFQKNGLMIYCQDIPNINWK
jgi:hypothetical protein